MFAALAGANVDWNVVAGAVATFVVTAIATAFGFRKGLKKLREQVTEPVPTAITGATLMDNMSMVMLTEAIRENTDQLRQIQPCLTELKLIEQLKLNKRD